ncbi:hypothetical protein BCR32DRAFT_325378 [Anaeromyces robustus]|uniref:Uncharacterized protein n=1 Tax=Anaeromyces robustus TaxID=1754192 RepID=A0A1Y1XIM8_9FUNG|nr:hypothetical protein BCR32DRAFT_325378 [Anaeromyces robustus]|eukprot:ORX85615.1 hypothetical protein BCR32DRAFT_325378 [Anaeromyces robustus]
MVHEIAKNKNHIYKIQVTDYYRDKEIAEIAKDKYKGISDCQKDDNGKNWCGVRHCYSYCAKNLAKELTNDMNGGRMPYSSGDILVYDIDDDDLLVTWSLL